MLGTYLPTVQTLRSPVAAVPQVVLQLLAVACVALSCTGFAVADAVLPERLPGLVATFNRTDTEGGTTQRSEFQRVDLLMQHAWQQPSQLDPRLDDGEPVEVTWQGALQVGSEGRYQLHVYVVGRASLLVDGREIAAGESAQGVWLASVPLEFNFGVHQLQLRYQSAARAGQVGLYWQGPDFQLEPISERYLTHSAADMPSDLYERGRLLAHALRCATCHESSAVDSKGMQAPELTRLDGNLNRQWLQSWLTAHATPESIDTEEPTAGDNRDDEVDRRMPYFGLSPQEAADITAALWFESLPHESPGSPSSGSAEASNGKDQSSTANDKRPARTAPDATQGKKLFDSRGCLACHRIRQRQLGHVDLDSDANYLPHNRLQRLTQQLFDGGDLSEITRKRPPDFFERWLAAPDRINADHRMPITALSPLERADLALYLAAPSSAPAAGKDDSALQKTNQAPAQLAGDATRGKQLLAAHRCGACHKLPGALATSLTPLKSLTSESRWDSGCAGAPDVARHMPGFQLSEGQRRAVQAYWISTHAARASKPTPSSSAARRAQGETRADLLLAQNNCTACHARGSNQGIASRTAQLVAVERELAPLLPALQPPTLTGVGDKLHDRTLHAAIEQSESPRRPWLEVRMPKYMLDAVERERLVAHLIARDRIPERASAHAPPADDVVTRAAAGRLVTSEGFGCQSCHQIGKQLPPTVALNARGTDLSMLGQRIRHAWFDRWVRNPVRIVPRMEMPAIQMPVRGVLGDDLDSQIDAVWEMLNTEGFQPPSPAPVRVVRGHNLPNQIEAAQVLTDVLETPSQTYLRPLIVGLGNRHNLLFDLEKGEVAQWWIGDTARELTRGKSWYWELGGQPLTQKLGALVRLELEDPAHRAWVAEPLEQFAVQFDALSHTSAGILFHGRIAFVRQSQQRVVPIELAIEPLARASADTGGPLKKGAASGIAVTLSADLPKDFALALQLDPQASELLETERGDNASSQRWTAAIDPRSQMTVHALRGKLVRSGSHRLHGSSAGAGGRLQVALELQTDWLVDQFVDSPSTGSDTAATGSADAAVTEPERRSEPVALGVVPGFKAVQLPLPRTEMPTALAWYQGQLIAASLKGRVLRALDRDGDGLAETWQPLSDDLPAPYGLATSEHGIDVVAKYGVLRLSEPKQSANDNAEGSKAENSNGEYTNADLPWPMHMIADGWGYTADYHDWAVGLVPDGNGNYFVALPCQQDDRSPSAARLRGTVQKLVPQSPTSESPRAFRLKTYSAGQRFPMGLAFNRQGDLFATDNQGNYNPFNELNHLQAGKRYGFINKLENRPGFNPPLESPAINLPHPWTRSVNGICFLDTPATAATAERFGPYQGQLVGCEYNGLSLIRMSLELVDGVYQGAAYMLSRPPVEGQPTFEGPVACAVSPDGDLYVGNIHDSGWGGGQNTGSIVRLTPTGQWPMGIGTVRALKDGLSIDFTAAVSAEAAAVPSNYSVRSYRRESTPAYGGSDQDERQEEITAVRVAPDHKRVELRLGQLRADCVYELRVVGPIAADGQKLFPSEAHYTMKRVPR